MPNNKPLKDKQRPNKYTPIPEGALKEKYKTQAEGRASILQIGILKGNTFNKGSNDFIMNIQ